MRYRLTFISGAAVGYVLGARAGRERYEQMRKSAREFAQNPTVRDAAKNAKATSYSAASKATDSVMSKVGGRLPDSITERVPFLRERGSDDEWGSNGT
jgi:hypothetical protein